ncbi:MAG TPA: acyltransferase family protein [Caulobacteraceae bacterium]|jgi:hypothetical protein
MPYADTLSPSALPRASNPSAAPSRAAARAPAERLLFIDNVRWAMIVLVLGMHAAVTYSPLGSWYYREHPKLDLGSTLFFATFQGLLQGFFMALLFFVAGYFAASSLDAKGPRAFLAGRLYRLGLPTLLFIAAIGPVTEYFVAHSWRTHASFAHEMTLYVTRGRFLSGTGPMWFCAALLIFCAIYAGWRAAGLGRATGRTEAAGAIKPVQVVLAVAVLTVATFLVRTVFPLGGSVFNMQLAYFPSYVMLFALGIMARRRDWITRVNDRFAWLTAGTCVGLALAGWPPLLALGGALSGATAPYNGGLTWQSAALSLWESLVCFGMTFGVLVGFRTWMTRQRSVSKFMSDNAFAVYVIHPPILVGLALLLSPVALAPLAKFAMLWSLGLVVCFGLAAPLARRAPLVGRIL